MTDASLSKEPLASAISKAMARILHEFYGKGPARARTYIFDNYVFCVLEDLLTTVERTLLKGGQGLLVRHVRLRFQDMKGAVFVDQIETLTGRKVLAAHSQIVFDPDTVVHMFVLEPDAPQGNGGMRAAHADIESVSLLGRTPTR